MNYYKEERISESEQLSANIFINHTDKTGEMAPHHWHDYYEVLYVIDGQASQNIEGNVHDIKSGDIIIIQPGEIHSTTALSDLGCSIIVMLFFPSCLNLDNTSAAFSRSLNKYLSDFYQYSSYLHTPYPHEKDIMRIMSNINYEATMKEDGYELIIKGYIYSFLGFLERIGNLSINHKIMHENKFLLLECCKYIEEHYQEKITLEALSSKYNYTKEYFSKIFKETIGQNFKSFLDYVRISEAERLIKYENMPIHQVAESVGYTNHNSFTRAYKRIKGYPPTHKAV